MDPQGFVFMTFLMIKRILVLVYDSLKDGLMVVELVWLGTVWFDAS